MMGFLTSLKDGQRVTVEEVEEQSLAEIRHLNLTREPDQPRIPETPMGTNYLTWRSFVALMDPTKGDQLIWRKTPVGRSARPGRLSPQRGKMGFQIVRQFRVRASYEVTV
jgi:hypothetical protein